MKLDLHAEQVGRLGGITGEGALKTLGAPNLDQFEIIIREAVQNSWDARRPRRSSIVFGVHADVLREDQRACLEDAIREGFEGAEPLLRRHADWDLLTLYDRGTRGLGGSIDASAETGGSRDFVRFVYMVGETKAAEDSRRSPGGTYGFGRSSFVRASAEGTILVHTRFVDGEGSSSRLIGMTWTEPYAEDGRRYTGRHWWGRRGSRGAETTIDPITGEDADRLAMAIGMPIAPVDQTGTTITILNPRWGSTGSDDAHVGGEFIESERSAAARRIEASILRNCWPHIVDGTIDFQMSWYGEERDLPRPEQHPRLRFFVHAYRQALSNDGSAKSGALQRDIDCLRPRKRLGSLGLAMGAFLPGGVASIDSDPILAERDPLRHVALMRSTRLVVTYVPCAVPREHVQYAGVFIADGDVDDVFARSEPPSHDAWVKERLDDPIKKRFVNVALRRIEEEAGRFAAPSGGASSQAAYGGELGSVSQELGRLLPAVVGDGIGPAGPRKASLSKNDVRGKRGGNASEVASVELGRPRHRVERGRLILEVPFRCDAGERSLTLRANVAVVVEAGGKESEIPAGADEPEVLGWSLNGSKGVHPADTLPIPRGRIDGVVLVSQPRDCRLQVTVKAMEGDR